MQEFRKQKNAYAVELVNKSNERLAQTRTKSKIEACKIEIKPAARGRFLVRSKINKVLVSISSFGNQTQHTNLTVEIHIADVVDNACSAVDKSAP